MKRIVPDSFEKQVLLALFVVGWLPVGLALVFTAILSRRNLMESESNRVQARSEQISIELQHYFDELESAIGIIVADPMLNDDSVQLESKRRELKRLAKASPQIIEISLHAHPYPLVPEPKQIHVRLPASIPSNAPVLMWWAKLEQVDQWVEVSTALSEVWRMLDDVVFPPNGSVALVSERGLILSHRDKELIHQYLPIGHFDSEELSLPGSRWRSFFVFTQPIKSEKKKSDLKLQLVSFLPKATVYNRILKQQFIHSLIGLVISLLALFLGRKLSKTLASHLLHAANVSVSVSEGDLEARIPERGPTEICTLAKSFNEMVNNLQMHQNDLEQTVAIRTEHLEQTAAQLQAAHDASKDGLWLVYNDSSGHTLNETLCDMFDLPISESSHSEELIENIVEWFEERDLLRKWIDEALLDPSDVETRTWNLTNKKVYSTHAAPVNSSKGELIAVLFAFTDLTEETRLHQELAKIRSLESVGHLSGSVAHEFNNLLSKVIGNLELISEEQETVTRSTAINEALDSSLRAVDLVKGMLSFSQQNWLELEDLAINKTIVQVIDKFDPSGLESIEINVNPSNARLPFIHGDTERLSEALHCLVSNAVEAISDDGKITISTTHITEFENHENGVVEILIRDTGKGIPDELKETMYQPFVSTNKDRKGLGLAVCHGIIEQHQGKIECLNSNAEGTTFRIVIPATSRFEDVLSQTSTASPATVHHLLDQKVMVVDDDKGVRLVTSLSLKKGGFNVVAFESGSAALEYYESNHLEIGLIVLDLRMPEMMGTEVLVQLRERFEYVPVIVCSGYLRDLDELNDSSIRPDATLEKPVPPSKMVETAMKVLMK